MKRFEHKYNQLTGYLMSRLASRSKDRNIVFSPLSFITLAAIAADASAGTTRKELEQVLRDQDISADEMKECLKKVQDHFAKKNVLKTANCIFVKPELGETICPGFEDRFRERFDGTIFSADNLEEAIDEWVNSKTDGLIKKLGIKTAEKDLFGMANAIAFNDSWAEEYEEKDFIHEDFTNADGSVSRVTMLKSMENDYVEDDIWEGFIRPYKEGGLSFMALLPKDAEFSFDGLQSEEIDFGSLYRTRSAERVDVKLPEFRIENEEDLSRELQNLGVHQLFSEEADFSPFSSEWLKGETIVHHACIEMDRNGTRASAAGFIYGAAGCAMTDEKMVYLTRPFVFAIVDQETGLPVFSGIVNHLNPNTHGSEMTWNEKAILCSHYLSDLLDRLDPACDGDGIFDDSTMEYALYRKARHACMHCDLQEMQKIGDEIDEYIQARKMKNS